MAQPRGDAIFTPVPSAADNEVNDQTLQLQKVDLKTDENGKNHRTSKYSLMNEKNQSDRKLVVRRGQGFSLELEFNRPYEKGSDAVTLYLTIQGNQPKAPASVCPTLVAEGNGKGGKSPQGKPSDSVVEKTGHKNAQVSYDPSLVPVHVMDEESSLSTNGWFGHVASTEGNKITITVQSPAAKCAVAKWEVKVELTSQKSPSSRKYQLKNPIYILFNPWCRQDDTYYPDNPIDLEEYVLADTGVIYKAGSSEWPDDLSWQYGQFSRDILDCVMLLLEHECDQESKLTPRERGDVVKVSRRLASLVNSDSLEPDGVLEGKWLENDDDEEYTRDGATHPYDWASSAKILGKYYKAKRENPDQVAPVRFGQCWVFAGVLTAVCRALGIPSRPITNYNSGHEKKVQGFSFTIDHYYDADTEQRIKSTDDDSVWSFHVWTEAWMKRDDLPNPQLYSGWQAIDATAQEVSDQEDKKEGKKPQIKGPALEKSKAKKPQVYVMGPAPVSACLRGDVHIGYDVDFLFGEVSSDVVKWKVVKEKISEGVPVKDNKCNFWRISKGRSVGSRLVTHYGHDLKDVTADYKHAKNTDEARDSMINALERCGLDSARVVQNHNSPLCLDVDVPEVYIGSPIKFGVIVNNKTKEKLEGTGLIQVYTAEEKGVKTSHFIDEFPLEFSVEPHSMETYHFTLEYEKYKEKVKSADRALLIDFSASVRDRDIYDIGKKFFCFKKPKIQVEAVPSNVKGNGIVNVTAKLVNTMGISIESGTFTVSSHDFKSTSSHGKKQELKKRLDPGEEASVEFELAPKWTTGYKSIISVNFSSKQRPFISAHGSTTFEIGK